MSPVPVELSEFLRLHAEGSRLLIDARSPKEFAQARIPGAVNLPLLHDEHRHIVGTTYKQEGREAAVQKGFELVGPLFSGFITQAHEFAHDKKEPREILIYCWRGGMRSGIMAWILGMAGFRVRLLKGGYKSFRSWAITQFTQPAKIVILGGKTGSGKTEALLELKKLGEQVIDLEGLAHHKGSAFGSLGQKEQPRYEMFENHIAWQLFGLDPHRPLWLENESNSIGSVKIPDPFFAQMRNAPVIEMEVQTEERASRILNEYGHFPKEQLADSTSRLRKRLGDQRTREALSALEEGRMSEWLDILLQYYDKTYAYGMTLRKAETAFTLAKDPAESHLDFALRLKKYFYQLPISKA